jgi:prepilin-type N-terminal cleavage/methylation domain-containing protein
MEMTRRPGNRHGFTMIEVLMAILIIGLIVPIAMFIQGSSWGVSGKANATRLATQMIEARVDALRVTARKDMTPVDGSAGKKGIGLVWDVEPATREDGTVIDHAWQVNLTATMTKNGEELLRVTTFVARDY